VDRVIMFDYDGVIADSLEVFSSAGAAAFRAAGYPQYATPESVVAFHEQNWFDALAAAGIPDATALEIEDAIGLACRTSTDLQPFPGMREAIAQLANENTVIIITSSGSAIVEAFLSDHGITGITRVMGFDVDTSKVRKIGLVKAEHGDAAEYWYVGDTVGDMDEARRAGVRSVAVTWGWHSAERLAEAAPDRLVHEPADLVELFGRRGGGTA
jgi:phosphoglycolate phosphatase